MVEIDGTTITMTRGDTLKTVLTLYNKDGTEYTPVDGDYIRFAMGKTYRDQDDSNVLIDKEIPLDTLLLHLEPDDTSSLSYGKYYYDVEITFVNGDVDTVIDQAQLSLTKEVK